MRPWRASSGAWLRIGIPNSNSTGGWPPWTPANGAARWPSAPRVLAALRAVTRRTGDTLRGPSPDNRTGRVIRNKPSRVSRYKSSAVVATRGMVLEGNPSDNQTWTGDARVRVGFRDAGLGQYGGRPREVVAVGPSRAARPRPLAAPSHSHHLNCAGKNDRNSFGCSRFT